MPAALAVDHEQVKVVAIQIGYREAARQFGLKEDTVCQWAKREGWSDQVKQVKQAESLLVEKQGLSAVVRKTPSDVLASYSGKSKLLSAKAGHSMLKTIHKQKGLAQVALAQPFTQVVGALSKVHKWEDQGATAVQVNVNLGNQRFEEV